MINLNKENIGKKFIVLLVLTLFINLPFISALELSNIRAESITENSAVVKWETDQPADTFVNYGLNENSLTPIGDASKIKNHEVLIDGLSADKEYKFSVESDNVKDDDSGNLYSFTTLSPDITPPELEVKFPEMVAGTRIDIVGYTEIGAQVSLYVDGALAGKTTAITFDKENFTEESSGQSFEEQSEVEEEISSENNNVETEENNVINETNNFNNTNSVNETDNVNETNETNNAGGDTEVIETYSETPPGNNLVGSAITPPTNSQLEGKFEFNAVKLVAGENQITVEVIDGSGNKAALSGKVLTDSTKPVLSEINLPEYVDDNNVDFIVNVSEKVTYEITVNNKSVSSGEGSSISENIALEEGDNTIVLKVVDTAGWEVIRTFTIKSDTEAPAVSFKIEKGGEYYQGKAVSNINGETEPDAAVYLYIYKPIGSGNNPDFSKAVKKVTADQNGSFTFKDVDFEHRPFNLKSLAPKEVPSGLQEYSIFPISQVAEQQKDTIHIFVISEDKSGKSDYAQESITINSCYSANMDFEVLALSRFQSPLRLVPSLVDQGRQIASAVFNFSYRGDGITQNDIATGQEIGSSYEIINVNFDKACTASMMDDDQFRLGCTIFPQRPSKPLPSNDLSMWYLTYNLHSSEKLSDKEGNYWDEFKKRQVIFPMKIKIDYHERLPDGNWGPTKTQTSCYDLSYFVDIPIDSKEMIPDFLANEGIDAISWTVDQIDVVMEYLEKAIMVAGVACISSFLSKMVVKWIRVATSKMEPYFTRTKSEDERCPYDQRNLLMKSTVEHWTELENDGLFKTNDEKPVNKFGKDWINPENSLDEKCPMTTNMWKTEAFLDQAYRWSCDRVLCRAVPAAWTSDKDKSQVDTVILSQQQCAATSKGIALRQIENCQDQIKTDAIYGGGNDRARQLKKDGAFPCYLNPVNNQLYYISEPAKGSLNEPKIVKLDWLSPYGGMNFDQAFLAEGSQLLAYKPRDSKDIIVGTDRACKNVCKSTRSPGYKADSDNGIENYYNGISGSYGCYKEVQQGSSIAWVDAKGDELKGDAYAAGYTSDCFVNVDASGEELAHVGDENGLLQCVCTNDENEEDVQTNGARLAAKESEGTAEDWVYRQAKMNDVSRGSGTYYPPWRYYKGRDLSGAFGANYLLDYARPQPKEHQVNPSTQHIGAFQSVCLSGIRARLMTLKSILEALKGCIQEAKVTGLRDAGVCKTIFSQQVCGLVYKALAYFFTSCSPYSFADQSKSGAIGAISTISDATLGSISEVMDESISEIQGDYKNANLNQFFEGGAKGFTESICMAAFGYDWPMGMDFILDTAYAFPMKSTVHVIPAERELVTVNPATGAAIFNYNLGAMILPGCRIRSADIYLKCVGKEDLIRKDVYCGDQGCDCMASDSISSLEGEKVKSLDKGRLLNLKQGSFVDMEIPSPQVVESHYRYDHVVVSLSLDPNENPENCYDEGYRDGKFYFPIKDISPKGFLSCQADPLTGKYYCPEVVGMFGGGSGAYFEDPYISCYDKNTQAWANCDTPGLFSKGDQIKIKAHTMTNGGKYCFKSSYTGLGQGVQSELPQLMPELAAPWSPVINLGTVNENMFSGTAGITLSTATSDTGCTQPHIVGGSSNAGNTPVTFTYQLVGIDQYTVFVPQGITVNAPYTIRIADRALMKNNIATLTPNDITAAIFNIQGFQVKNLIGRPQGPKNVCIYQLTAAVGSNYAPQFNQKSLQLTFEILLPDASDTCHNPNIPVKAPGFGKNRVQKNVIIQLEPVVSQVASKMHQEFMNSNHNYVQKTARSIISRKQNDLEDALAVYYLIADYVSQSETNWKVQFGKEVCNLMNVFEKRDYMDNEGIKDDYPEDIKKSAEFIKIGKYLGEIKTSVGTCSAGNSTNEN